METLADTPDLLLLLNRYSCHSSNWFFSSKQEKHPHWGKDLSVFGIGHLGRKGCC